MSRRKKFWIGFFAAVALLIAILIAGAVAMSQSRWFKDRVRSRIASVLETATGGRVEIGHFEYDWRSLTADVGPLVLHGTEPPGEAPLFQAQRIRIGLKIISVLEQRVDIQSLAVDQPRVNVIVNPDGSTNIPKPRIPRSKKNVAERLLDLKVRHFELHDGFARYNSEQIPLEMEGDRLAASVEYDRRGPRYLGQFSSDRVHLSSPRSRAPVVFGFNARVALGAQQIQILEASVTGEKTQFTAAGVVTNLSAPKVVLNLSAKAAAEGVNRALHLPLAPIGTFRFEGQATGSSAPFDYNLDGKLSGQSLVYSRGDVVLKNIALSSHLIVTPRRISFGDVRISALDGQFRGAAEIVDSKKFSITANVSGVSLKELATLRQTEIGELRGTLDGSLHVNGEFTPTGTAGLAASAKLDIIPGAGPAPVHGSVMVDYDQRRNKVQFTNSQLILGSTTVTISGTLGEKLAVHMNSANLGDVLPLFSLLGETPPEQLPITLHGGSATFNGEIDGPLNNPTVSGKIDATQLALDQREFDHITSSFTAQKNVLDLHSLSVQRDKMHLDGRGRLGLVDWKITDASPVSGTIAIRDGDIKRLISESGYDIPVTGDLSATAQVSGTLESPLVNAEVDAGNVTAYDEHFDRIRTDVTFSAAALELSRLDARSGSARVTGGGEYNHPANDWKNGSLRVEIATRGVNLSAIHHVQNYRPGLGADVVLQGNGTAKVVNGAITPTALNGDLSIKNVVVDNRAYGNLELTANTRLPVLAVTANVDLRGVQLQGSGEWRLEGDYPGQARMQIPRISFATLHDLWPGEHLRKELPFDGFIQGEATISGPLNNPDSMKANVSLSTVRLNAGPNVRPVAGTQVQDLVLRNAQPVVFDCTTKTISIESANFVAKDTTLTATGRLAFDSKSAWDAAVNGSIDLAILQIFNPDLLAAGKSVVNVTVRGPFKEPQVDGRVDVRNASVYIRDLPNGVDQANGLILFDRNRATIQNLSGVSGGGTVEFESGSFVGFRGRALVYRLQATAHQVRYRSPEGISMTGDATLSLVGTSENSVLSGNVRVTRAAFNPRTDVGSLLASTEQPVSMPGTNEYLQGIHFDVRIVSSRNLEVETSLTHNIQAESNLSLRGTPDRPIILGNILISSGEIEFFGNKYKISRGDVNFYNPARLEPVIDMELETRVRGIIVDVTFSGPLSKLKFSYRSDPPLETNEIIPLLALGRTPSTLGGLPPPPSAAASNLSVSGNSLVSQALSPSSGRLERFFGVAHIKIDPQLTDITAIPQDRLTLEEPVSADVTFTYITNLARTDEQIVRIEWDFSKKWSVVALRDENGAFGIDFQYRKRFK